MIVFSGLLLPDSFGKIRGKFMVAFVKEKRGQKEEGKKRGKRKGENLAPNPQKEIFTVRQFRNRETPTQDGEIISRMFFFFFFF